MKAVKQRLNEKGQTAIFVAMIFQVLFVLFAMSINIGLVVHDKINLQNSVDFAAYYAAQKQAEILNAIGHTNYQIRQAWKLLSWRYRVLGTLGLDNHPIRQNLTSEVPYPNTDLPSVCVTYSPIWKSVANGENLCRRLNNRIPPLPSVPVIAPFLGINAIISALSISLIAQYDGQCRRHGAFNWWFAASSMMAFRIDQAHRKKTIFGLAQMLSNGNSGDFFDLNGQSVAQGAFKTLEKNLTFGNKSSEGGIQFQLFHSLHNVTREQWLPEIQTIPTINYIDVDNSNGCNADPKEVKNLPGIAEARDFALNVLGGNEIKPWVQSEPPTTHIMHMSMGVEKNPWYMAYVGVRAETKPRQVFFPFGPRISMVARAYAKPFGGRISPWYHSDLPRSSSQSVGPRTDPLAPPRTQQNGLLDSPDDITLLPNYSRFPGDSMGLKSALAINGLKDVLGLRTSYDEFKWIFRGMVAGAPNDPLAWDYDLNQLPPMRRYELSVIAP
ncbi:MAG: Tad domain-containing protein, partial [Bdellovibrionales bacterium]|nr:Tad domain-containing protein [Bdellovibrionales bacterium]